MMAWQSVLLALGTLLVLGLAAYAFCVEPYRVRLSKVELAIANLPDSLDGFTICHLSDTHTSRYGRLERKVREILAGVDADLCTITGDLYGRRGGIEALKRVLSSFNPRLGVFAVLGNGDHKLRMPMAELASQIEQSGIRLLLNSHVTVSSDGQSLDLIGVGDPFLGFDDLSGAMSGLAEDGFKLLLAHSPDVVVDPAARSVNLILAGHTHGGQVRLPFIGPVWLHCRHRLGISEGYFGPEALSRVLGRDMHESHMYVSRGLAGSGVQARFMCPPEILLITLRQESEW